MYAHLPHIFACSFSVDAYEIISVQYCCHSTIAIFRMLCIYLVNDPFNLQLFLADRNRLVIKARPVYAQKFGLLADTELFIIPVN